MCNKPIDLTEFNRLEQMLKDDGITYEREDSESSTMDYTWEFHQLRCPLEIGEKWVWDVVCSTGTYGYEKGLLEIWGKDLQEPEGWLRADECFEKIKAIIDKENRQEVWRNEQHRRNRNE